MSARTHPGRQCVAVLGLDETLRIVSIQSEAESGLASGTKIVRGESLYKVLNPIESIQCRELETRTALGEWWTAELFVSGQSTILWVLPARDTASRVVGFLAFFFREEIASESARGLDHWQRAVMDASDHERLNVARLLHDGLWPHILGAAFLSRSLAQRTGKNAELGDGLEKLNELIHSAVQQSKKILSVDAGTGLPLSLRTAILEFSSQFNGGRECEFVDDSSFPEFSADVAANCFRLVEDVVLQSFFDYHATRAVVRLECGDGPPRIVIVHNGNTEGMAFVASTVMRCRVAVCDGAIGFHVSPNACIAMILLPLV